MRYGLPQDYDPEAPKYIIGDRIRRYDALSSIVVSHVSKNHGGHHRYYGRGEWGAQGIYEGDAELVQAAPRLMNSRRSTPAFAIGGVN